MGPFPGIADKWDINDNFTRIHIPPSEKRPVFQRRSHHRGGFRLVAAPRPGPRNSLRNMRISPIPFSMRKDITPPVRSFATRPPALSISIRQPTPADLCRATQSPNPARNSFRSGPKMLASKRWIPLTVRYTLTQPSPYFLGMMAHQFFMVVHRKAIEKYGERELGAAKEHRDERAVSSDAMGSLRPHRRV